MAVTATDETREHYLRPEVKEIVTRYAMPGEGAWRALNGDFHRWYKYGTSKQTDLRLARLLNSEMDYEYITASYRTLYCTLNVFDKSMWLETRAPEEITSDNPMGTPAGTEAYTLGCDIDKGHGYDIEEPVVKRAVEAAAQFLIDYLKENGIHRSVWPLFSGGGIYVMLHHGIGQRPEAKGRAGFFGALTDRYNRLLRHVSEEFFKAHPEYVGKVKYDALNNSKRVFKCILSIHKSKPYAVIPLNREKIEIDFERAKLPLNEDVLADARSWYATYEPDEGTALFKLLDTFIDDEDEESARARQSARFSEIWRSTEGIDQKYFPPCIRHIIDTPNYGEGKTRFAAVLSTFLYHMGWTEDEAWNLVKAVSDRNGVSGADHIFDTTFGVISCPTCQTIQNDGAGYPHLGLKDLGACNPLEECDRRPGDYAVAYFQGDTEDQERADRGKAKGKTVLDALAVLLEHEQEAEQTPKFDKWGWRLLRSKAKIFVRIGTMPLKEEAQIQKTLKTFADVLATFGIDYEDLYPIPRVAKSKKEEFDWRVKALAWKIIRRTDPLQYITDSCGQFVLGAETAFKKLVCCISAQNINQTAGMHPKLNGESSGGKTITVYSFAHHLPAEMVIKGSMSNKAGFYHNDGDRVLRILDDYQAGNEDLDTVIKQTSSEFHQPYAHRTVINQMAATLTIGKEQVWAITSVDGSQDIQVLNRQLPINVDDSEELTKRVNDKTVERYTKGEPLLPIDKRVLVCRAIMQIYRDLGYINVRIPFGDRIEWLDTSNRRNPSLFMDLVVAVAAMRRFQREKDENGFYLADEDDFNTAKDLFSDRDAEELVKRLTTKERQVTELLILAGSEGMTRDQLAEKISVSPRRISQILQGEKGSGGLTQKVRLNENKISDMIRVNETHSRTVYKTVYSLKDYDRFAGFDGVVRLKPASEEPGKQRKDEGRDEGRKQTTTGEDEGRKGRKKEKEREKREREPSGATSEDFSHKSEKIEENPSSMAEHSEKHPSFNPPTILPSLPRSQGISKNILPTSNDSDNSEQARITQPGGDGSPTTAPAPPPDQPPVIPSGETDPIWRSIDAKLRKMGRKDGAGRRGLAVCDLEPGELEFLRGKGWTDGTIEVSGVRVLWAPAKSPEGGA